MRPPGDEMSRFLPKIWMLLALLAGDQQCFGRWGAGVQISRCYYKVLVLIPFYQVYTTICELLISRRCLHLQNLLYWQGFWRHGNFYFCQVLEACFCFFFSGLPRAKSPPKTTRTKNVALSGNFWRLPNWCSNLVFVCFFGICPDELNQMDMKKRHASSIGALNVCLIWGASKVVLAETFHHFCEVWWRSHGFHHGIFGILSTASRVPIWGGRNITKILQVQLSGQPWYPTDGAFLMFFASPPNCGRRTCFD